jgi:hypothetical protein
MKMKKRDYLRSQGFRVGDRGRFTEAMKIVLAQYDGAFEEDMQPLKLENLSKFGGKKKGGSKTIAPAIDSTKYREPRTLYGFTKEGVKVGFVMCSRCNQHMVWCNCSKGVYAPKIVTHSTDNLVFVPSM